MEKTKMNFKLGHFDLKIVRTSGKIQATPLLNLTVSISTESFSSFPNTL